MWKRNTFDWKRQNGSSRLLRVQLLVSWQKSRQKEQHYCSEILQITAKSFKSSLSLHLPLSLSLSLSPSLLSLSLPLSVELAPCLFSRCTNGCRLGLSCRHLWRKHEVDEPISFFPHTAGADEEPSPPPQRTGGTLSLSVIRFDSCCLSNTHRTHTCAPHTCQCSGGEFQSCKIGLCRTECSWIRFIFY